MSTYEWKIYREPVGALGVVIEWWYDKHARSWVVRTVDEHGEQLGDAEYSGTKEGRDFNLNLCRKAHA